MPVHNPSSALQADATSGQPTEQRSTGGAAHVTLAAGTASVGSVALLTGTNNVGNVGLLAGTANVGNVALLAGTASVGSVTLNAGANIAGSIGGLGINVAASLTHVPTTAVDVQGLAALANRRLTGYSITEVAGVPGAAEVTLRHGTLVTDPEIATHKLALSTDKQVVFGTSGVAVPNGVFVDVVVGTVKLTLFWSTVA